MKSQTLIIAGGILLLATSCNNSAETATTKTDTVRDTVTNVVEVVAPIDSAAITAEYLAAENRSKKANPGKPKKQGDKEVTMYPEEPIPSHEALEQEAAVAKPATPEKPAAPVIIHTKEYVYFAPSEKASFPGGQAAFNDFVKKNIDYPEDALKFHVEGTVFADVYLDSIGTVTKVEFPAKHLGHGLEEETEMILMRSPRWIPAKENGIRVKSKLTLPITYKING